MIPQNGDYVRLMGRGTRGTHAHESELIHGDGLRSRIVVTGRFDYVSDLPAPERQQEIAEALCRMYPQLLRGVVAGMDALEGSSDERVRQLINAMDSLMLAVGCQPRFCVTADPASGERLLAYPLPGGELLAFASSDLRGETIDERACEIADRVTELAGICLGN